MTGYNYVYFSNLSKHFPWNEDQYRKTRLDVSEQVGYLPTMIQRHEQVAHQEP